MIMFNVNEKLNTSQNPEEDILEVFKRAVSNGQTRLALEALVDVIDAIVEIIIPDEEEQEEVVAQPTIEAPKGVEIKEQEKPKSEEKQVQPKKAAVKETKISEELNS
jgi:hypothetical protein